MSFTSKAVPPLGCSLVRPIFQSASSVSRGGCISSKGLVNWISYKHPPYQIALYLIEMAKRRKDTEEQSSESEDFSNDQKPQKKPKKVVKNPTKDPKAKKSSSAKKKTPSDSEESKVANNKTTAKSMKPKVHPSDFVTGQKYMTPPESDGAAAFYESMYQQNPKSEMARKYMVEYGMLQEDQAKKLIKEITKKK